MKEQYHAALVAAENRMERSQSSMLTEMETHTSSIVKSEVPEGPQTKPSSPEVSGSVHWWES